MPSPLQTAGALTEPSSYAALHMGRLFTGLWTNRSPLRDAATSWAMEKQYAATRQDSIWDGLNSEISSRLTLIRRPGTSVYNEAIFPPINRFYEFRTFSTTVESILLVADTAATVYNATGPETKSTVRNKAAAAGATYFQSVGNTLYMGDGVDQTEWVQSTLAWTPNTARFAGDFVVDSNNNIQSVSPAILESVVSGSINGNVIFFNLRGSNPFPVGATFTPTGLTLMAVANGVELVAIATPYSNTVAAAFVHADIAQAGETGSVATAAPTSTGAAAPAWNETPGGATFDGGVLWYNKGPAVTPWGIVGPTAAPTLASAALPAIYPEWTANTDYSSSLVILDTYGNIQALTTSGVTGTTQPTWAGGVGTVTVDGTAKWTNRGSAAWTPNTAYASGAVLSVFFTYYIYPSGYWNSDGQYIIPDPIPVSVTDFFLCTTAGESGAAPPAWIDGNGTVVGDNTVVWTNQGSMRAWVGASQSVSTARSVLDSNGNLQTILVSGISGPNAPQWATAAGATTTDSTASWTNAGPYAAPATSPQLYSFAFGNSVTGEKSNASPLSASITVAANSLVILQGQGSGNRNVDTIYIYRTARGGSTQLLLDQIPAPSAGQMWTYFDNSTDDDLTVEIQAATALQLTPPPAGAVAPSYHVQRIFVAVQNVLSWSSGPDAIIFAANGNSGFPPLNSITFQSRIVRTWPCALGLIVFTISDIFIVLGTGTSTDPFYATPFLEGTGLISYDAFTVQGTTAYILTTSLQLLSLDPSAGVLEVGFPIADQIERYYSASSHLAFHSQSSEDTALYAADGNVGWFRMAATSAPESGFNWSPRAIITGGCTALSSVEISPGVKRLLLGPQTSGPILMRDRTTSSDNGTPYVSRTTLGNVVLAQPGQVAQLDFIALTSLRVGTAPALSVLLGEISGTFESIRRTRQEPPMLYPSSTLYSDRYALAQNGRTTVCGHLQMQVSWPAEDAANELIAFTFFGALLSERKAQ